MWGFIQLGSWICLLILIILKHFGHMRYHGFVRTSNKFQCSRFYLEFRYFFTQLTKEKKLVWQSSREAPLVCELTFVILRTFCFPQIYTILGCIGGLLGRKMRKCASVIKLWWRLGDTTSCWKAGFPLVDSRHVILAIKMADRSNWPETAWWDGEEHMARHLSSTVRS